MASNEEPFDPFAEQINRRRAALAEAGLPDAVAEPQQRVFDSDPTGTPPAADEYDQAEQHRAEVASKRRSAEREFIEGLDNNEAIGQEALDVNVPEQPVEPPLVSDPEPIPADTQAVAEPEPASSVADDEPAAEKPIQSVEPFGDRPEDNAFVVDVDRDDDDVFAGTAEGHTFTVDLDADEPMDAQLERQGFAEEVRRRIEAMHRQLGRGQIVDDRAYSRRRLGDTAEGLEVIGVELALTGAINLSSQLGEVLTAARLGEVVSVQLSGVVQKRQDARHGESEYAVRRVTVKVESVQSVID